MEKRFKLILALLVVLSTRFSIACGDGSTSDANVLPALSREFLQEHFSDFPISHIHIDRDFINVDCYDVILTDGTNVEFDRSGRWLEVKRHNKAVPSSLIPSALLNDVAKNYPHSLIVVIERESDGYEIKLDNELEIKYDLKGNILRNE